MSREHIIRQILRRECAGRSLLEQSVRIDNERLIEQAVDLFGSWDTALQYSGVSQDTACAPFSQEQVIRRLRDMCRRGYKLSATHNQRRHRAFYNSTRRHFGTWRNALLCAGIRLENATGRTASHMDREMLLAWILERSLTGGSMNWTDMCLENRDVAMAIR